MIAEEAWVAKYLPGFGSPRLMYCSEFRSAMQAVIEIIEAETPKGGNGA